ncbi:unnamed protein product [Linum trigynum]|uniref:RNase H type-1 domain-containing protein n=1 Tax=Linum trigynum TaxID=586398 RepID=A0AAV2FPR9_9ROSI
MGLNDFITSAPTVNFSLWWQHVTLSEHPQTHVPLYVCVLWRIWKSRNKVVFEHLQPHAQSLARQCFFHVREVSSSLPPAPAPPRHPPSSRLLSWVPPPDDFLKINFDAAVRVSGCSSGLVVRGADGHVALAVGFQHSDMTDPYLAELLAARDAISLLVSKSLPRVIIEGDSEVVVRQLCQGASSDSLGGPVLRDCFLLLASVSVSLEFRAVPRSANRAAHRVAQKALLLSPLELCSFDFVGWLH